MTNQSFGDTDAGSSRQRELASGRRPSPGVAGGLRKSINSTDWGVLIADPEGFVVYANMAFLKLFGYGGVEEVAGCPAADLFAVQTVREVSPLRPPVATKGQVTKEFRVRKRRGGTLDVEVASSAVRDARGTLVGVMVSFADRALQRKAERERERLLQELREALSRGKTLRSLLPS